MSLKAVEYLEKALAELQAHEGPDAEMAMKRVRSALDFAKKQTPVETKPVPQEISQPAPVAEEIPSPEFSDKSPMAVMLKTERLVKYLNEKFPSYEYYFEKTRKYVKVIKSLKTASGERVNASVYAFIALEEIQSKALSYVRPGDILKAATYNAPARGRRGNVFEMTPEQLVSSGRLGEYGTAYFR